MSRKPTISPTKISIYLACPVKYRWTYMDSRGRWYMRAKSSYSFGSALHRVLERFHDEGDVGVETTGQIVSALEESWIDAGYQSAEEMSDAFSEGITMLTRHAEEHRRVMDATTLAVEKQLKLDMGEFILLGRLDRIDEYPDGTLEVVDYKTGRASVSTDEVALDIAMGVYQLLLRAKYPGRPVRARIVALRSGESATACMTDEEAADFERAVLQIGTELIAEDYYNRMPVRKPLCASCDFLKLCQQDPAMA